MVKDFRSWSEAEYDATLRKVGGLIADLNWDDLTRFIFTLSGSRKNMLLVSVILEFIFYVGLENRHQLMHQGS